MVPDLTEFAGACRSLGTNAFSGTVPKSLASLSATMTELNVASNQFTGISKELAALTGLKVL